MLVESTKENINAFKIVLADDFSARAAIEAKVKQRIEDLKLIFDDEPDAVEAAKLYRLFLLECEKHANKLAKLEQKEQIYESTLRGASPNQRPFILKKLEEIDKEKQTFT